KNEEEKSPEEEEEKSPEEQAKRFYAGSLYFFPTFFTRKGMEIINPQDREKRAGSLPIPFESVPAGSTGTFTLLYVPFISEEVENWEIEAKMNNLTVLAHDPNHENLLRAEAEAWLHDFWKCTDEHVEYEASEHHNNHDAEAYRTKYLSLLGESQITLLGEGPI